MPGGKNPAAAVRRHRESAPEIRYLNLAQIGVQLRALAQRPLLQTMVAVLIYAGLRREEVLWLTVDDVDLKAGTYGVIRIRAKTVDEENWQPKTKANRAVPVSNALRRYLERYEPAVVPGRWFFPSSRGKRWSPDGFSQALRKANKKAGLTWNWRSFASNVTCHGRKVRPF